MRDRLLQARARNLRRNTTDAEKRLWSGLRKRRIGGWRFRRQVPLGKYIADFACLEAKLIVEVDGGQHQAQWKYDRVRQLELQALGFRVLRFWNHEVLNQTDAVFAVIYAALGQPPP